ncbi:MAG TPA: hypothetical protein VNA25_15745 [Phycisphaerae bacterium]|nr:hypothetical protein [Phycisphaerae bacterium]
MNAEQKRAWLGVVTMSACVVGYFVLLPLFGPIVATAAFAFYGINGFAGLIGRKEKPDERDKNIARRATLAGAMASYLAFIIGCMGTWFVVFAFKREEQVWVHVLGTITMLGAIVFFFTRSVAILVLYGRHVEADNA